VISNLAFKSFAKFLKFLGLNFILDISQFFFCFLICVTLPKNLYFDLNNEN